VEAVGVGEESVRLSFEIDYQKKKSSPRVVTMIGEEATVFLRSGKEKLQLKVLTRRHGEIPEVGDFLEELEMP
jgi:hypothetical protein